MRNDGKNLEIQVKYLFKKIFEEIGFYVHKTRIQKAGTQDGFDDEFKIIDEFYRTYNIYIECKDYTTKPNYSEAITKIPQIISSYNPDILIFVSPHKPFGNPFNDSRLENFYTNFKTPIEFLTPDNDIEKFIALDKKLYQDIYKKEAPFEVNRIQILEDFKKFIFSTKPLKKVIIRDSDREQFITNIQELQFYISRNFYLPENSESFNKNEIYFQNSILDLDKLVFNLTKINPKNENKIINGLVILGNPGMGKSVELKELAIRYWNDRDNLKWIPFYRNVSNFTSDCKLQDHLPNEWENIPQLLIILDGLDEVSFAQNFRTKLEKFILDSKSKNQNIKFIISCRTNIYQNTIKNIESFKCYILDKIKFSEAFNYLEKKFKFKSDNYTNLTLNKSQKEFFEIPYFLNLFGDYYSKNNILPSNKSDLFEKYIQKRLNDDDLRLKETVFDKSIVLSSCKKIALILEAMQENEIKDGYLNLILGNNKQDFINSCFIQKVFNSNSWEFEHRSLQEFLVAKTLSTLSFNDIISFISIDEETSNTHPSWFNSITYLINVLDEKSELYAHVIDWLIQNDYEILLKADTDRITDSIKAIVFQKYFTKRCIKDNLWISKYGIEAKELATFANCHVNIDFLINQSKNINNHRRARISAINVISNMTLNYKIDEIKLMMLEMLTEPIEIVDSRFKSDIIYAIKELKFHSDENYIREVIKALDSNDHHFVTGAILQLIKESNADNFFHYLQSLTPKIIDANKRKFPKNDNFSTYTEEDNFKEILKKFNNPEHLVYSLKTFLKLEYNYKLDLKKEEIESIINKLNNLQKKDSSVYDLMIKFIVSSIDDKSLTLMNEAVILTFIHNCNKADEAFKTILNTDTNKSKKLSFSDKRHFLSELASENNIDLILNEFQSGNIDRKNVLYFRNNLIHKDYDLAFKFQKLILDNTDLNFDDDQLDYNIRNDWAEFHKTSLSESFDLLFNQKVIIEKAKDYFSLISDKIITWKNNLEDRKSYYDNVKLRKKFPDTFMNLIHNTLLNNNGKANLDDVLLNVNNELYLITKIYEKLKSDKKESIILTKRQIEHISRWCFENIDKVTFNEYSNKNDNNRNKCELLWFFRNYLDLSFSENQLLEMLFIDGSMFMNDEDFGYDYIIKNVEKKLLDERIIDNLKNKNITPIIFKNHAIYALKNGLDEVNDIIKKFISTIKEYSWYYRKEILYVYFEKTNDIAFLKSLFKPHETKEHSDDLSWIAIQLLMDSQEYNFVANTLNEFYKNNTIKSRELTIIKYLIISNHDDAFKILYNWIINNISEFKSEVNYGLSSSDWKTHNNIKSIPYLIDLIKLSNGNKYNFREISSPERLAIDVLNNISKTSDYKTSEIILKELIECKELFEKNNNTELFYINTMINNTKEVLVKHKSKPMRFDDIAYKIDSKKYLIL
ncbi:NACHT domain-containing protein [Polaribacter porphyrae]|uniref:NACHT domain-containing protein n=1 Tax=Polaribacter porphyrae TaxID=1137780 RepID=A0A2S7WLD8_9FLAO|nr:NACHT domain-containing protein [Polaribacter porphyrae]PQJ78246.1 hypothetical protein BTO18_03145 [Polaribacter porphyrae]